MNDPKRILIVLLGLCLVGLCVVGIKHQAESSGYKNQVNYVTAVQATDKEHFNYVVDSQQGRVLSTGTFKIDPKNAVKFDEMNKSYGYVRRTKEHYTQHEREVCETHYRTETRTRTVSDSKGNYHTETYTVEVPYDVCHQETYYSWDYVDDEKKESPTVMYFDRSYPLSLFRTGQFVHGTNCEEFMAKGSGSGWLETKNGCLDGDNYIDDNNRYTYDTMPLTFSGTFLATTYGGLKPFNESSITLQQKTIPQVLKDVGQYKIIGFWVSIVVLVLFTIIAGIIAYGWVMEDGVWSLDR